MIKNPFLNALVALVYIALVASVMWYGSEIKPEPSVVGPIAILSLFTLSAAAMGYIFLYKPIELYFDGKKKAAIKLFFQTMLVFGGITAFILALLFSGIFGLKK